MIEQAELNRAFFARYGKLSQAELFGRHGDQSRAKLFFAKARAKTKLSRAKLWLGPNTTIFHPGSLDEVLFKSNLPGVVFELGLY